MNELDDKTLNQRGFAFRDLLGIDRWEAFTPAFTSLTVVGATTYTGRFRVVGRLCQFQVTLLAATSIASTAGTTYMALPVTAAGIAGIGSMMNNTTNIAVGDGVIDATNSRFYLPTQGASSDTFALYGEYEI